MGTTMLLTACAGIVLGVVMRALIAVGTQPPHRARRRCYECNYRLGHLLWDTTRDRQHLPRDGHHPELLAGRFH